MSLVRENLMKSKFYRPYCGNDNCKDMPRTSFNGEQFVCSKCKWVSQFDSVFITQYKQHWGIS